MAETSLVQKNVQLSKPNVARFEQLFPKGNLSYTLDLLLERFVAQYDKTQLEYAEIAARELKESIE